jgi:hypothetical protein
VKPETRALDTDEAVITVAIAFPSMTVEEGPEEATRTRSLLKDRFSKYVPAETRTVSPGAVPLIAL